MSANTEPTPETTPTRSAPRVPAAWAAFAAMAVVALLSATAAAALAGRAPAATTVEAPGAQSSGISITATSTVHATPDMATVYLGVSETRPTIASARSSAATDATKVMSFLLAAGVEASDVTTSDISLYQQTSGTYAVPQYCIAPMGGSTSPGGAAASSPGMPAPVPDVSAGPIVPVPSSGPGCVYSPTGWVYSESLVVVVRDLDKASGIIDGAIANGATSVGGISFDVSTRPALEAQARAQAVKAAHDQAAALASAAGAALGKPLSVSASFGGAYYDKGVAAPAAAGGASTVVSPGTLDITATVTVVYAIG